LQPNRQPQYATIVCRNHDEGNCHALCELRCVPECAQNSHMAAPCIRCTRIAEQAGLVGRPRGRPKRQALLAGPTGKICSKELAKDQGAHKRRVLICFALCLATGTKSMGNTNIRTRQLKNDHTLYLHCFCKLSCRSHDHIGKQNARHAMLSSRMLSASRH